MPNIIDGKAISLTIKEELKTKAFEFEKRYGRKIGIAVVMVGNDPASQVYVKNKIKTAEFLGYKSFSYVLPETSLQKDVEDCVKYLANDDNVDGIIVQLPLPKHLDSDKIMNLIPLDKDVDGFNPINIGNLFLNKQSTVACTPYGILRLIKNTDTDLCGKNAVIVGRSNIVGKPMAALLLNENCTVTICHSKTRDLKTICNTADILVVAVGKEKFITADMVKQGAVVIDVGINRTEEGLVGDVDFDNVKNVASYITPVPGGVGPMTIAMLMENTYNCAIKRVEHGF